MSPTGKIIKSIAGFYEVYSEGEIYRCRAKGIFRALDQKPLVGDNVQFDITDTVSVPKEGNVTALLQRKNDLIRPNVANVDQALLLFAVTNPEPSLLTIDRLLITMQQKDIPVILCFNKTDLSDEAKIRELEEIYVGSGCRMLFICALNEGTVPGELMEALAGKTTVLTGPSGAGKSTLINLLCPKANMETGALSKKVARGKNTTRHVELLYAGEDTFLVDTPGFTSFYLQDLKAEDVGLYYPEFAIYAASCHYNGCNHLQEPGCMVKKAVREGKISRTRYLNYREICAQIRSQKPVYDKNS